MKASKKDMVEMSPSVVKALTGFKPIFGLSEDIQIVQRYEKIITLLSEVDSVAMRKYIRERKQSRLTPKMKEIREMEKKLIDMITERNIL